MATTTVYDVRRTDLNRTVLRNPYWVKSAEVNYTMDDYTAIVISFPAAVYGTQLILITEIGCEITTAWAGGTITLNVGSHTLATDAVTTEGDCTTVDTDEFIPSADITMATKAMYWPDGGDWFTARQANLNAAPLAITPADTTVPCIGVAVASDDTITAGALRIHMLIHELPCSDWT